MTRARRLLGAHPTRQSAGASLPSRLGQRIDGAVLAMLLRRNARGQDSPLPPIGPTRRRDIRPWPEPLVAQAHADRGPFFDAPPLPRITRSPRTTLPGGVIEDLSFPSFYAQRPSAIEMLRRYPENSTAVVRHYRHSRPGHPAVLCLHGWRGGNFRLDAAIVRARWLYQLGLDVYLYVHPHHGPRLSRREGGGSLHPSADICRTNEALLQTAWELRALMRWHDEQAGAPCGALGISLGGYVAAMLASVAPELRFVIPVLPVADLAAMLWTLSESPPEDDEGFDELCRTMAVHAPLAQRLAIPEERVLIVAGQNDGIVPPSHARALWEHWGQPRIHWFEGGHLLHFGREGYWRTIQRFLREQQLVG